jgi:hypothetical protein
MGHACAAAALGKAYSKLLTYMYAMGLSRELAVERREIKRRRIQIQRR